MTATADIRAKHAFEHGFLLGELRVDAHDGEVTGPGGREQLDPKVMSVLLLLAEHAGHVVLREDLLSRLWPNAVVTDDVLSRCIYELRRQLSQAGGDEQLKALIETVPKRGYRLNGEVTPLPPQPVARSQRLAARMALIGAGLVAAGVILWIAFGRDTTGSGADSADSSAPAEPPSIAVLPFVDMSEGQDHGYLADGMAEEILNRLARSKDLRVISRTSSFAIRGKPLDVREIATKLDVDHVLEGSVRRAGDRIRITAQLIAASDQSHLWSETYDRTLDEVFAVQDEIAQAVADNLRVTLASPARGKPPANTAAYERFLAGRLFHGRRGPGDPKRAVQAFEEAVGLDPGYAAAWAALAGAYVVLIDTGDLSWNEGNARQRSAAEEAIRLDPSAPEGYERLAQHYFAIGDLESARANRDKARSLPMTGSVPGGSSTEFIHLHEDLAGAIEDIRRTLALDPLSAIAHQNLGFALFAAGRLEEARLAFTKANELSPEMERHAAGEIARVLIAQRKFNEARAAAAQYRDQREKDYVLALLAKSPGHRAEADEALARLAAIDARDPMHLIRLAEAYAMRGMNQEAFKALSKLPESIDVNDPRRFSTLWWYRQELGIAPFLAPLHADRRWKGLMTESH